MFKFLTIVFGLIYLFCVALWTMARFGVFGFDRPEVAIGVLRPLSYPWIGWFRDQLTVFTAPLITLVVLVLAAYLATRNTKGHAR